MPPAPLVSIHDLTVQFRTDRGWSTAVEGVSFDIGDGDCVGVVGESGSGKSVTALSMLRLHARRTARFASGSVRYDGRDLLCIPESDLRRIRGRDIAMVFQDPMSSLNPVLTICDQISVSLRLHRTCRAPTRAGVPSNCSTSCASPMPAAGSTSTRIACRVACASA
jgi:peptide/nickel transport system ATP-binding protein